MRCYKIQVKKDGEIVATRFAGTAALTRDTKATLVEEFGAKKKDVESEEVDIPMAKADLLEFINELAAGADLVDEEE